MNTSTMMPVLAISLMLGCSAPPQVTSGVGSYPVHRIHAAKWPDSVIVGLELSRDVRYDDVVDLKCFGKFWKEWSYEAVAKKYGPGQQEPNSAISRFGYETEFGFVQYEDLPGSGGSISKAMSCIPKERSLGELVDGRILNQIPIASNMTFTIRQWEGEPLSLQFSVAKGIVYRIGVGGIAETLKVPS